MTKCHFCALLPDGACCVKTKTVLDHRAFDLAREIEPPPTARVVESSSSGVRLGRSATCTSSFPMFSP